MPVGERTKPLLPAKATGEPFIPINMIAGPGFYVPNQIGQGNVRILPNKNVGMVGHAIDRQKFLALAGHDSGHVLLEFFLAFAANEALARLDRKYDMNVDLRVGIGHAAVCFGHRLGCKSNRGNG